MKRRLQGAVMNELREYDCYLSFEVQIFHADILFFNFISQGTFGAFFTRLSLNLLTK